jgi:hypothetical protein
MIMETRRTVDAVRHVSCMIIRSEEDQTGKKRLVTKSHTFHGLYGMGAVYCAACTIWITDIRDFKSDSIVHFELPIMTLFPIVSYLKYSLHSYK